MREALDLVRRDLGSEALIVSTKTGGARKRNGLAGREPGVEVVAAVDYDLASPASGLNRFSRILKRVDETHRGRRPGQHAGRVKEEAAGHGQMQGMNRHGEHAPHLHRTGPEELTWMTRFLVRKLLSPRDCALPEQLVTLSCQMLKQGLCEHMLLKLLGEIMEDVPAGDLHDGDALRENMVAKMKEELLVSGPLTLIPGRRTIAALVGPTGVGKTTTLAKLAALHALDMKRKVALMSIDTYRIAAVEQLRIYASIMNLPFQAVSTPEECKRTLERFAGADLVLIDTAGRSQRDRVRIEEMKPFLREVEGIEICLVMSSTHREDALLAAASQFDLLGVDRLIFTKLDENATHGGMLNHLAAIKKPLSYLTTGQRVPEDIEVATQERLVSLVLGEAQIQCC